ncbi:MAG TPA: FkbM family methyltransferase [Acidimicrobiales bacterium]|nr:FkbM family methyltransferase [Acidimicrobiales bacterium]
MGGPVATATAKLLARGHQAAKALDAARSALGRRALRHGVAPAREHRAMLADLQPRHVLDVGANRGQFALEVCRSAPAAAVLSFEPLPAASATFRAIFAEIASVELRTVALGSATGPAVLHVAEADDSSSLLAISELQSTTFPGTHEAETLDITTSTLDAEVEGYPLTEPALLKLDVQGAELEVIRGARATLDQVTWVYVECSFQAFYTGQPLAHEIVAELREHGLALTGIGPATRIGGRVVQADLLFSRPPPP